MVLEPDGRARTFVQDERLRLPHHLVLGRDGALYVASDHDGRVWRVSATGALTEYFNSTPVWNATGTMVGSGGDPFTIDAAGNVYAVVSPLGSTIVRITPDARVTPVAARSRFGPLHFRAMAWGPPGDGALYLSGEGRIWRIIGDSATAIVPRGVELHEATGISVDSVGALYVADYAARRVVRLARDGAVNTPATLARLRLHGPTGVTLGPGGEVYVLDHPSRGVAIWRVRGDRVERVYHRRDWQVYLFGSIVGLLPLLLALQTWARKPSGMTDWLVWTLLAGVTIVALYWVARGVSVFSWLRHLILAVYVLGVWKSYQKIGARGAAVTP